MKFPSFRSAYSSLKSKLGKRRSTPTPLPTPAPFVWTPEASASPDFDPPHWNHPVFHKWKRIGIHFQNLPNVDSHSKGAKYRKFFEHAYHAHPNNALIDYELAANMAKQLRKQQNRQVSVLEGIGASDSFRLTQATPKNYISLVMQGVRQGRVRPEHALHMINGFAKARTISPADYQAMSEHIRSDKGGTTLKVFKQMRRNHFFSTPEMYEPAYRQAKDELRHKFAMHRHQH